MRRKSVVFVFLMVFVTFVQSCVLRKSQHHNDCGALIRSTCSDNLSTKWNKKSVGPTLKHWIKSVTKISSKHGYNKEHIYLNKKIKQFKVKDNDGFGVQYISNLDCQSQKTVGPTWMKPSTYSNDPLHDGFLYGMENENGEITGNLIWLKSFLLYAECLMSCKPLKINVSLVF